MTNKKAKHKRPPVVNFGKHKDTPITRVPRQYLTWMVNMSTQMADEAREELERRGDTTPVTELSGHAIDRASLNVLDVWKVTRTSQDEGLYSWLQRMVLGALEKGEDLPNGRIRYMGMELAIEIGEEFPALKTVVKAK